MEVLNNEPSHKGIYIYCTKFFWTKINNMNLIQINALIFIQLATKLLMHE